MREVSSFVLFPQLQVFRVVAHTPYKNKIAAAPYTVILFIGYHVPNIGIFIGYVISHSSMGGAAGTPYHQHRKKFQYHRCNNKLPAQKERPRTISRQYRPIMPSPSFQLRDPFSLFFRMSCTGSCRQLFTAFAIVNINVPIQIHDDRIWAARNFS